MMGRRVGLVNYGSSYKTEIRTPDGFCRDTASGRVSFIILTSWWSSGFLIIENSLIAATNVCSSARQKHELGGY